MTSRNFLRSRGDYERGVESPSHSPCICYMIWAYWSITGDYNELNSNRFVLTVWVE